MTKQEAAKWIRLALRTFEAHPEQWGKGQPVYAGDDGHARYCALGGAAAMAMGHRAFTVSSVIDAENGLLLDDLHLWWKVAHANDKAHDVPDMIRRVTAVLDEAGL